jgi:hypothetical protein
MRYNRKTFGLAVTPHGKLVILTLYYQDFAATPQSEIPKRILLKRLLITNSISKLNLTKKAD